jgi:hypothetical protein
LKLNDMREINPLTPKHANCSISWSITTQTQTNQV